MCRLVQTVARVNTKSSKINNLFETVSAQASGAPTCSLEGILNSGAFNDFERNQHVWKHKSGVLKFASKNMSKGTMREWVEFMDGVVVNNSKSIVKT